MPVTDMDRIRPLYDAIQVHNHEYSSGGADYSVTTLLDPPRVVHLKKRHGDKVPMFIEDLMHSFTGTANHKYLEYCLKKVETATGMPKYKLEERNSVKIHDRVISGAFDVLWLEELSLWDLKSTSTWKAIFGDKSEWAAQQNMYRYLYHLRHGVTIKQLNIIAMFRDWSLANKMRYGVKYPTHPVMWYPLPRFKMAVVREDMEVKVQRLIDEELTLDDDLPQCSFKDMWADPDKWAVKATNRKNALRVCDSHSAAVEYTTKYTSNDRCKHNISQLFIEHRPSVRKRCESWCSINGYCNQYHAYLKTLATEETQDGG